jgi:hypothetical protein
MKINPERVLAAYRKMSLTPTDGDFSVGGDNQTCPIGALYCQKINSIQSDGTEAVEYGQKLLGDKYFNAFWHGFDNSNLYRMDTEQMEGFANGRAVRAYLEVFYPELKK